MLSSSCGHLLYPRFDTCSKPRFQSSVFSCPGLANSPLRGRFGAFWAVAGRRWHPKAKATRIFVMGRPRNTCQRAHTYTRNMHPVREQIIRVQMFSHTCTWAVVPCVALATGKRRGGEGCDGVAKMLHHSRSLFLLRPTFLFRGGFSALYVGNRAMACGGGSDASAVCSRTERDSPRLIRQAREQQFFGLGGSWRRW